MRMKISYSACLQERTLNEHILLSILKTYDERGKSGLIEDFQSRDDHPRLIDLMEGRSVVEYTRLWREKDVREQYGRQASGVGPDPDQYQHTVI